MDAVLVVLALAGVTRGRRYAFGEELFMGGNEGIVYALLGAPVNGTPSKQELGPAVRRRSSPPRAAATWAS